MKVFNYCKQCDEFTGGNTNVRSTKKKRKFIHYCMECDTVTITTVKRKK